MKWHIGCSGFSYKEWKNIFYPPGMPQREWFSYYSTHFATLELNVTFYRFPSLNMLQNWYDKSPPGFSFAVKVPQLITHFKQLVECEKQLEDLYTICRDGLKEKLGPLLFQFPPSFKYTEERMQRILTIPDPSFKRVVEFRDAGWWNEKVYALLKEQNLAFCGMSYPGLPEDAIITAPFGYYRFHGVPKLYYSEYNITAIQKIADSMLRRKIKDMYCYFNNSAAVGAVANARSLENYVKSD